LAEIALLRAFKVWFTRARHTPKLHAAGRNELPKPLRRFGRQDAFDGGMGLLHKFPAG